MAEKQNLRPETERADLGSGAEKTDFRFER